MKLGKKLQTSRSVMKRHHPPQNHLVKWAIPSKTAAPKQAKAPLIQFPLSDSGSKAARFYSLA